VRKAFKFAQAEKPGASFIDFPENIADMDVGSLVPLKVQSAPIPCAARGKCRQVAEMITKANNPIIIAGNGIIRHGV